MPRAAAAAGPNAAVAIPAAIAKSRIATGNKTDTAWVRGSPRLATAPRWLVSFAAWRRFSFLIVWEAGWVLGVQR